ncbi:metallophosphoesterase [Mesonia sp. K7]|uniref:metallophosphoesterase n=1 Tax=Mesonia sp. K7 TaxID=2218606 RepID=UPI000DAAB13F|nr:metallophosphoesterase [Mesonia sp. K7]PZD78791.1 metallophosphoesterase [Mesonia sp. K7]
MRWIIFGVIFVLLSFYSLQAIKTVFKNSWINYIYIGFCLLVVVFFTYQWLQPSEGRVLSIGRSYAMGFLLSLMIFQLLIVVFLLGEDIYRIVAAIIQKFSGKSETVHLPSRRKFISTAALGLASIPFLGMLYGMYRGKYNFRVLSYELEFDDLPDAFDGYQLTQISDIHSGSFDNYDKIAYAVDLINQQQSDAILFTGDLVNNLASEMHGYQNLFSTLKAKDGVFSVLGNHDYGDYVDWENPEDKIQNLEELKSIQQQMGWKLLLNEHHSIERENQKIAIVGVENWGKGFIKEGDIDKAAHLLKAEDFKIVMSHDPSYWQEKIKSDTNHYQLTLSGHTHGMQFGIEIPGLIKWSPVKYRYKNWAGIYEEFGRYINVNRGFGYLGYPGRIGIWPEITVIKLKKKQNFA